MSDWKSRLSEIYAPRTSSANGAIDANVLIGTPDIAAPPGTTPTSGTVPPASTGDSYAEKVASHVPPAAPAEPPTASTVAPAPVQPSPGRTLRLLGRRSVAVVALEIAADGQTLIAAYADGHLRLMRAGTGMVLHGWSLPGHVHSLALSPDGRRLAVALSPWAPLPAGDQAHAANTAGPPGTSDIQLYNLRHGTQDETLQIPAPRVQCLCFDPTGRWLAVAAGRSLTLWDPASGHPKHALQGHAERITCLAFSPDGDWLIGGDAGGDLCVWDTAAGQGGRRLQQQGELTGMALSGDGAWLAWGARDGTVQVSAWTPQTLDRVRQIEGQGAPVAGLRFTPDHRMLVIGKSAGRRSGAPRGLVRLWSTERGELETEHAMDDAPLSCLAMSPDGRWLAVGSPTGEVRIIGSVDGRTLRRFVRDEVGIGCLALSPDKPWLVSGDDAGRVSLWQADTGALLRDMSVHRSALTVLGFSADGHWWASGAVDGTVLLWGRGSAHPVQAARGLESLSFCPRNRWLALAAQDGTVHLVPLREPIVKVLPVAHRATAGAKGLRFSAHGELLVWASEEGVVTCWDPVSQQVRSHHTLPLPGLKTFTLSDDLCWLAASANDGSLLLWDLRLDRPVWRHTAPHAGGAARLLIDAEAQVLHATGDDGTQTDWALSTGQWLGQRGGAGPQYRCLGLLPPRPGLHVSPLARDSIRLLQEAQHLL
jgi:WD40 repeat protein